MIRFYHILFILLLVSCNSGVNNESGNDVTSDEDTTVEVVIDSTITQEEEKIEIPHFEVIDTSCLPYPDERFMNWIKTDSIFPIFRDPSPFYPYLITHLDSLGSREIIAEDETWGVTEWKQTFYNGISYHEINEPELGGNYIFKTACKNKAEFLRVFQILAEDVENSWNEDSTKYYPKEIGCSYDIERSKDSTWMAKWYCGC